MRFVIALLLIVGCEKLEIYVNGVEIHQPYKKCAVEIFTMIDGVEVYECLNKNGDKVQNKAITEFGTFTY